VFAARRATSVAIKLAVWIEVVSFEVPIDRFSAGACGAAPGGGLDHHEWCVVLLGYLRWRKPGLLQRGILAEQRFLQRPSHTLSLKTKIEPPVLTQRRDGAATHSAGQFELIHPPQMAVLQRYSITRGRGYRLTRRSWAFVEPT
jgi:hypothetical protein